jgi:hypothetical protein
VRSRSRWVTLVRLTPALPFELALLLLERRPRTVLA